MTNFDMNDAPNKFVYEVWVEFLDTGLKQRYSKVFIAKAPATTLKNSLDKYNNVNSNCKNERFFIVESQLVCTRVFE